jgi:hypothetical protein
VVVVAAEEYNRLVEGAAAGRGSFAEHLLRFPGNAPANAPANGPERLQARPRDVAF